MFVADIEVKKKYTIVPESKTTINVSAQSFPQVPIKRKAKVKGHLVE